MDFAGLLNYLVNKDEQNKNGDGSTGRKVLVPPVSGTWEGAKTTAIGIGTEAHSLSVSGGPVADLYFTNWREEEIVAEILPSPSSSPSDSNSVKPGDTDSDGDIDIFDYNIVVTDFGKTNDPNTKADLDNDNDVDIFDYNLVVSNFGK